MPGSAGCYRLNRKLNRSPSVLTKPRSIVASMVMSLILTCFIFASPELPGEPALKRLSHRRNLDPLVGRRCRMGGVQQLLLAQTDRLKAF